MEAPLHNSASVLRLLVEDLSRRSSEDTEKVLLHIIDSALRVWGERASDALRMMRDPDITDDLRASVQKEYDEAFSNAKHLSKMKHRIKGTLIPTNYAQQRADISCGS